MSITRISLAAALVATAALGAMAPAQAGSSDSAARAAYRVSLKASTVEAVQKQDVVKLTGKVSPKAPGTKVTVQIQYDGQDAWRTVGKAKVKSDGSYAFTDKPTSRLDRSYRVVKPGDRAATRGTSRSRGVEVFGWDWLDARAPSASANVLATYVMPINGDDYGHTLYADKAFKTGFTEFTLGRKCLLLDTTVGLSDRTETGGQAGIKVSTDGVAAYERAFTLGQDDALSLDVDDVYRVRIDFTQLNGTPATEPSAGAARVLCD